MYKTCINSGLSLLFLIYLPSLVLAQIPKNDKDVFSPRSTITAAFTAPDTVCVNSPVTIKNISSGASSYFWNFCVSSINTTPKGTNLGNINGAFSLPVFSDYVEQNGNYYLFVVNNYPGNLVRLDFGNSMLNTPTAVMLGNFGGDISNNAEGIQVVNVNGKWLAIIVGGFPAGGTTSRIIKLDFGSDISNISPVSTNWGNIGNMDYPIDLHVFQENNKWYGFTLNSENQTITRFDFGADFTGTPSALNLGDIGGFSGPTGIFAINDNGFWRVFITSGSDNSRIHRLDFGSSLLNSPTTVDLGNIGGLLRRPRDIYIMKFCDELVGFIINGNTTDPQYASSIIRLNFNDGLGQMPEATFLGNIGELSFPHSISRLFRDGPDLYSFITNVGNNTITRLRFEGCTSVNIPNSTQFAPPAISYSVPGTYNINLLVDDGLPTQTSFCKTITVIGNSSIEIGNDTAICEKSSLVLSPQYQNVTNVVWSTGQTTADITVSGAGKYWLKSNDGTSCASSDTITISSIPLPVFSLGKDTLLCDNGSISLKAPISGESYLWNTGETTPDIAVLNTGNYSLGISKSGCSFSDTIRVVKDILGYVNLGNDTALCGNAKLDLVYLSKPGDLIKWSTGDTGPSISVSNQGIYWLDVSNNSGCKGTDSIKVEIGQVPVFSLGPDTAKCVSGTIKLASPVIADKYLWSTGTTSDFIDITVPGIYSLSITNNSCSFSDTINVITKPSPIFSLGNDTALCKGETLVLDMAGIGDKVLWNDGSTITIKELSAPGIYSITIEKSGCSSSDELKIVDRGLPILNIGPDTALCFGQPMVITPVISNGIFKNWENGSTIEVRTINQPAIYIGAAENGCGTSFDTLLVKAGGNAAGTYNVANAFSPNGDGKNDCFGISKLILRDLIEFSVYNRYGQKIFSAKNLQDCWNGTYNGIRQPEGAYVYVIRANSYCGFIDKKGVVILQR
ncbi:gliding motility-associated C-terminal domain-containing protein [Flavihumibacter fluvii]|uniref:gliding motility-associated C-terminal domain-containing protein n=1 Tax=Flavihumibacter fluvii TaxID=2838157 RepID=UPI001BDEDB21|nr:gliding motility-associated C-terminal domain-containing protein [Flavihumibacter fluvii]ULQ53778.1 gliding motility-associated C-terminal domain-containing protein [Flavihumibacter fluvii]